MMPGREELIRVFEDPMIYLTADLHFGHENIIRHVGRPFSSVEEMDQTLIRNWNDRVGEEDEVYILGDVTMKGAAWAEDVLGQLRGRKYLVRGNHDRFAGQQGFNQTLFQWIKDYHEMAYAGQRFILFHYPILEWNHYFRKAYHLHGHQHNGADYNAANRASGLLRYDVGVDANDFAPVSIEQIMAFFAQESGT